MEKQPRISGLSSFYAKFLLYVVSILLLIFLMILLLISMLQNTYTKEKISYLENRQDSYLAILTETISQVDQAYLLLQFDHTIQDVFQMTAYRQITPTTRDGLSASLNMVSSLNGLLTDVSIRSDLINYSSIYSKEDLFRLTHNGTSASSETQTGLTCGSFVSFSRNRTYLYFSYPYFIRNQQVGHLIFSIDIQRLAALFTHENAEDELFVLADEQGVLAPLSGQPLTPAQTEEITQLLSGCTLEGAQQQISSDHIFQTTRINAQGLTFLSHINQGAIKSSFSSIYAISFSMILVLLVLFCFGCIWFYYSLVSPLKLLTRTITRLQNNTDMQQRPTFPERGCFELRTIIRQLNLLLQRMFKLSENLMRQAEDLYQIELLKKNAELEALRAQINPHFLYNTLELIRSACVDGNTALIDRIVTEISAIYRYIVKGNVFVPLSDEIDMLESYFFIQKARFPDRITSMIHVPVEAMDIQIPKMLLQPLVENAFIHGLESMLDPGMIFVNITLTNGALVIQVRDNGVGIEPERLQQLQASLRMPPQKSGVSIGLFNVHARIWLRYGSSSAMTIDSKPGDGTCIVLHLPLPNQEGENENVQNSAGR